MELSDNLMYTAMQRLILLHYQKVLYVDLTEDFYSVLKIDDNEWNMSVYNDKQKKISEWFSYFAESDLCHNDDRETFRNFANLEKFRKQIKENEEKPIRCTYRRKIKSDDQSFTRCVMEIFPYTDKNMHQIIFLFVREATKSNSIFNRMNESVQRLKEKNQFIHHKKYNGKKRILVVDDNSINRNMLKEYLSDEYEIIEAENGLVALDILFYNYQNISAIVLDLYMPVINGFEFLKKVQLNPLLSTIPILVATSATDNNDEEKSLSMGATDFVKKPFNPVVVKMRLSKIIKMKEASEMVTISEFDLVTGFYTKEAFCHHIEMELNNNPQEDYDIVVSNIDNYASIEQCYGKANCEKLLPKLTEIARNSNDDVVFYGRIGERTFASLVKHTSCLDDSFFISISEKMADVIQVENMQVKFGVYELIDKDIPATESIDRAVSAMNSISKKFGKVVAFYDKRVAEIQAKNFEMESAFESAIAKEDFEVWFQPKYSTKTKTVVGAEALIRWRGKDGNLISPAEFIPLFETDGLIPILDEYVFKKVCEYQKMRLEKGKIIVPISVNLSRASMFKKDFIKNYAKIANDMGISRSCVPIEITESMAVKSSSVKSFAEELINEGFSLHMDDFGAGYSSLASLQILRFDVIKLDKSLIDFIGTQSGESLIKHTVAFAKESGMKVVAEGVEKKEQLDFLREINCDYIQGFYFAAPMPQKEFDKLLTGASKN